MFPRAWSTAALRPAPAVGSEDQAGEGHGHACMSEREAEQNALAFAQGESETARRAGVCYACVK